MNLKPYSLSCLLSFIVMALLLTSCSNPEGDFKKAEQANTEQAFSAFIKKHPGSPLIAQANQRLAALAYETAKRAGTGIALEEFLNRFSTNEFSTKAKADLEAIEFQAAKDAKTISAWEHFLKKYPASIRVVEGRELLAQLAFAKAAAENTVSALENFTNSFPQSKNVSQAREILARLNLVEAQKKNSLEAYAEFLKNFPGTGAAHEATNLAAAIEFKDAERQNDIDTYQRFILKYPSSALSIEANKRLTVQVEERDWNKALVENTPASYAAFRKLHPDAKQLIVVENDLRCILKDPTRGATIYPNPGAEMTGPRSSFENLRVILSSTTAKLRDLSMKDAIQFGIIGSTENGEMATIRMSPSISGKRFLTVRESTGGEILLRIVGVE